MGRQTDIECDWTKRYRLAAGVYAMRGQQILMLERAAGMMIGFWSIPGGIVDPGEPPSVAAARELLEEAAITPTGPLWLVSTVHLKGYGMDLLSLRYACQCDAGDVRLSHEHTNWGWMTPETYRITHLSDAEVERWRQSSPDEAFNVLGNRDGLDDFVRWRDTFGGTVTSGGV
jgi:8-oxo-dGTP pyrophosphatase MutT (NUDIX family)